MQKNEGLEVLFSRILFCTDFSKNADEVFSYALKYAGNAANSELHILHVVPESKAQFWKSYMYEVDDVDEKAKHDIDEYINTTYCSKIPEGQSSVVSCRVGNEVQEILSYAKENDIDVIIMGRQGRSWLATALFGKITEKVSRHAECAVMILPNIFVSKRK